MERLRVLIVDDEPPAREKVRRFVRESRDVDVVGEAGTGPEAVDAVRDLDPDLMFLDVQMPGMDGFEVLDALGDMGVPIPDIVFATAYDEFALRAFEVHAVDYLLKPFDRRRFHTALQRARERSGSGGGDMLDRLGRLLKERGRLQTLERILVEERGRSVLIPVHTIDWIGADGNYVTLHVSGRRHLLRRTLTSLAEQLPPDRFVRVHRSAVVNLDRVRELVPEGHGDYTIRLETGATVPLSRRYRAQRPDLFGGG